MSLTKGSTGQKQRLVVVGNGMAGVRLVEELLARDSVRRFDIVVFGDEPCGAYDRIRLPSVLAGTEDPGDILTNPLPWYERNGITLRHGVRVSWIDRVARRVHAAGRLTQDYDQLVLATGSAPFVPPIDGLRDEAGNLRQGIFTFRTLSDCEGVVRHLATARKAVVIGGGMLGLETAGALLERGLEVHVVHRAEFLMGTQLDPEAGDTLKGLLEKTGIHIHLGQTVRSVLADGQVSAVALNDGAVLECGLIVIAAGARPNATLARQAGLAVQRGIVVNDDLCCPDNPGIYAIGDCAEHRGQVYGTVAPAWEQARILADRLTGNQTASYRGTRVSSVLKVSGADLTVLGETTGLPGDEVITYAEPSRGIYKKLVIRDGRLGGAILLGDNQATPAVLRVFHGKETLPENRADFLLPARGAAPAIAIADLPPTARICNCNGVSKGTIVAAVNKGFRTLRSVCEATRAGTGCGSCKPQIQAILDLASGDISGDDPSAHYYVPGVPLTKPELTKAVREQGLRSVSAVFNVLAGGREDADSKTGLASLLKTIWGKDYQDERDARFINDRVHANVQKDGTFSVVPRIHGGIVSPAELRRIAEAAEKHHVPMIKITGGQRISLFGIPKEKLPEVWKDLGMPSGHAYTRAFRTCKTCVGVDFCRYGLGDSAALGIRIEKRFQGMETPHKMKLAVSGCPRNCAEATTKDLGLVAVGPDKWEIYVGGAAGSRVRKGDTLSVVDSHDQALAHIGRLLAYYREQAKYQERTYDFVQRIGPDRLRQVVADAGEVARRLDEDVQAAVDAYSDPWKEAERPVHAAQFVTTVATIIGEEQIHGYGHVAAPAAVPAG